VLFEFVNLDKSELLICHSILHFEVDSWLVQTTQSLVSSVNRVPLVVRLVKKKYSRVP
jgi:hypothetical protein